LPDSDHADTAPLERGRFGLGSWRGFGWRLGFQQLGLRSWRGLRGLNLRGLGRDPRLRLSLDWLNLKRLRQGRGLNRLDLAGLLFGSR
jgi:hypothetical protein